MTEAPYNPRKISDRNRANLKASLEKSGLVMPIVLNSRTGTVVGGHQRLSAMDSLMRTKKYALDVAVIDVDEKEEVALNIALNNGSAMGEFDFVAVKSLSEEFNLDLETDFLFDRDDLLVSFGVDLGDVAVQKRDASADEALMQAIRDRKKEVREKFKGTKESEGDYTSEVKGVLTVVFDREKDLEDFLEANGVDRSKRVVHSREVVSD